jgi:hypothetical protein
VRALAAFLLLAALAGCGGGGDEVSDAELGELRRSGQGPFYWVGRQAAGLPLTHAQATGPGRASFLYGDCDPSGGLLAEGGCGPPIQIQTWPFRHRQWAKAYGCSRLPDVGGLPAARHDSLVVFTGTSFVKIYARSPREERQVALALRSLEDGRAPQPPAPEIVAAVERACGST